MLAPVIPNKILKLSVSFVNIRDHWCQKHIELVICGQLLVGSKRRQAVIVNRGFTLAYWKLLLEGDFLHFLYYSIS